MKDGLLMFAKYAFPPNLLQLCGPKESRDIFEILAKADKDLSASAELKKLLLQFEGAIPYLRLIAAANGIKDLFDLRVVEAYWLGNDLLKNVRAAELYKNVGERFREAMKPKEWSWLAAESVARAKPFHGFHVFDIYRRLGLLRSGEQKNFLETMDKCRIGWGKIESINMNRENKISFGSSLASCKPLEFREGKLGVGEEKTKKFFLLDPLIKEGDYVSLHWDYICEKLIPYQLKNLIYWTGYHLDLTNKTI